MYQTREVYWFSQEFFCDRKKIFEYATSLNGEDAALGLEEDWGGIRSIV